MPSERMVTHVEDGGRSVFVLLTFSLGYQNAMVNRVISAGLRSYV